MKILILLLLAIAVRAEDTIPVFDRNQRKNKIKTAMWIDSLSYNYMKARPVNQDSLRKEYLQTRKKNLSLLKAAK